MSRGLYCLQCNAVVGRELERGESARGDRLDVCQTCAQHGRMPIAGGEGAPPFLDLWGWLARLGA